jgi:two-component system NtrC family sensor kinase
MRTCLKIILLLLLPAFACAQQNLTDSLRRVLKNTSVDSIRYNLNVKLHDLYEEKNLDSALYFAEQALLIARKNNKKLAEAAALNSKGYQLRNIGKYGESLQCLMEALTITENPASEKNNWSFGSSRSSMNARLLILSVTHHMYALLMQATQNTEQEIFHYKEEIRIAEEIKRKSGLQLAYMNLGNTYLKLNKVDTALNYAMRADSLAEQTGIKYYNGWNLGTLGDIYIKKKEETLARQYYYAGIQNSKEQENLGSLIWNYDKITRYYLSKNEADSSLYYAKNTLESIKSLGVTSNVNAYLADAYENLYSAYKLKDWFDSAYKYQGLTVITKDSVYKDRIKNLAEFQNLTFSEQLRLQNVEKDKVAYQNKIRTYFLLAGISVLLLLAIIFYRNNLQKHKANIKIEKAYAELKATQSQLVQSEKMASLGELTAGIAHEIQNPLNFVNNFSEVNKELLIEMNEEIEKGNYNDVKAIAKDVIDNQEKINHHGKRADAIVKGMLQHSRSSSGIKEPTNINALADEYLRLAYHGLRAKDPRDSANKSFNATMKTDYDESIGNINIIPQDIGRVILNLINNAFYAVSEKNASTSSTGQQYEPTVSVSTKKINDKIEIKVADNGNGIPQKVLDKIFQPFFTTKPTGQGTGLGLSLSYDIIKAHGGELKVETKEGEGAEFIIQLPLI